jgi:hypothetical protein
LFCQWCQQHMTSSSLQPWVEQMRKQQAAHAKLRSHREGGLPACQDTCVDLPHPAAAISQPVIPACDKLVHDIPCWYMILCTAAVAPVLIRYAHELPLCCSLRVLSRKMSRYCMQWQRLLYQLPWRCLAGEVPLQPLLLLLTMQPRRQKMLL